MQQLVSVWQNLTMQRRVIVLGATALMFVLVLGITRLATSPGLSLLYAGLETGAAGEVVAALEARGVDYEIRGDSIFVDSTRRDELRMTLASEGLPATAMQGYELLDTMSGFGTTSQMFDAAYWRAKEGELARTIVTSPNIQAARVYIANSGTKPFQRDLTPSASVTVTPSGGGIAAAQAKALRYLVASAVPGLKPENVAVIDSTGGVILSSEEDPGAVRSGMDRATTLKRNVERLLEARVGYGKAVVEVNVETVTEAEEITERRIDPESRVAISQDSTQSKDSSTDPAGDDVTVASNLPDGEANSQGGGTSTSSSSESRERTNFDLSETNRRVTRAPGSVARITTAVLIDGLRTVAADGTVSWAPRPDEEMAALRELVSAAVGLDEARGDRISVRTMQFEPLPTDGTEPIAAGLIGPIDTMRVIQLAILALVVLVIALFVIRPIFGRRADGQGVPQLDGPDGDAARTGPLTGEIDPEGVPHFLPQTVDAGRGGPAFGLDAAETSQSVQRLRQLIGERQEELLQILKSWMEDEEKA